MRSDSSPARKLPLPSPSPTPPPKRRPEKDNIKKLNIPRKVQKKLKIFSVRLGLDLTFLFLVVILLIIGMIMMFSASYPSALEYTGNSYSYLLRQMLFAGIGVAAMIILSYFDYHHFHKLAIPIMIAALLALVITLFIPSSTGVHRWIGIGSFNIQSSEIAKFAVILFLAHFNSKYFKKMDTFRFGVLPGLVLMALVSFLLILEPHYSGIVIIAMLIVLMMFISGVKLGYAMQRLDGWGQALNYTTEDMWQSTYQTRNSLYAIGSGGIWGLGLGQSRQKYLYIPEVQNDFVFAVVCEELGFVGAAIILCIFALLVWRGITLSMRAKDKFGSLLGIGLSAQIGLQVILNIMVITDWLPNTGISLPFFSYGGSSLIMLLAQMGIVLSISRTSNLEKV